MPETVLRHPKLPGQPIVLDVPLGGVIAGSYKAGGWELDPKTSPDAARAESVDTSAKAVEKADKQSAKFVAGFEPDTEEDPAPKQSSAASTPKEN